jgi:hypothetical protein
VLKTQTDALEDAPKAKRARMMETASSTPSLSALSIDEEVASAPEPEESVDSVSGSDYGKSREDTCSEDKDDSDIDLENDEPDTVIKHKSGPGKKLKKGLVAQDQINKFAAIDSDKNPKAEGIQCNKCNAETGTGCESVYI